MAATVAGGGEGGRLQGKESRGSGSLVLKISWGEEGVTTVAVTVDTIREDTIREDTTKDTTRDTTKGALDSTKDSIKEDVVSVTTS